MLSSLNHSTIASKIATDAQTICQNQVSATLAGLARRNQKVEMTAHGALVAKTGQFTGRSPNDKYIVRDSKTEDSVWWDNTSAINREEFDTLLSDMLEHMADRNMLQQQLFAGADDRHRFSVNVFTPSAWHALFIRHLLIRPTERDLSSFDADVTVLHLPNFEADLERHGTKSSTCIALDLSRNIVLICGTQYAGEIKKSVFSLFNYHAPDRGVFPMHCSANQAENGDTTLFFGLSGTGKTTLSTSASRALIGDDEHGWSEDGIFNLEGGCYAKAINLSAEGEPEIFAASQMADVVMENVILDENGLPDFDDTSLTENTRIAYPLTSIPHRVESGKGTTPKNVVLLTADAFGVLPPLARLSPEQAIKYFVLGYTAKLAGTERGVTEPKATFSACFGAPFMARHPAEYAAQLSERLSQSGANCWLLNTGWTGGAYGVGRRMKLADTRHMLEAALNGDLDQVEFSADETFGLMVPTSIPGIGSDILNPRATWENPQDYDQQATKLRALFAENFARFEPRLRDILPVNQNHLGAA